MYSITKSVKIHLLPNRLHLRRMMSLLRNEAFIGGNWVTASSGKTFQVHNPANSQIIGTPPDMDCHDVEKAISAAHEAFKSWKELTAKERAAHLRKWLVLMQENADELAKIMTQESGKPLAEAKGEIAYGASFVEWFAEEARRIYGDVVPSPARSKEMIFIREPIGVAGMITPWNFPNAMITRKAAAAMASGCTCVVKPAEDTPFSALALAELAHRAGLPQGVFNVVTCSRENTAQVGNLLCTSKKVAGISFTGSTAVGQILYRQCASGIKRLGLELGGNAPFIVFDSASLKVAVDGLMVAKFRNAGQTCVSANRVYVQSGIYESFIAAVVKAMDERLKVGDGIAQGVTIGPLINEPLFNKVSRIVSESVSAGATVVRGGRGHAKGGLFYEPTLLLDVTEDMPCVKEEIFGPVVAIQKFESEAEVIAKANDSERGLASYFFSSDVSQVLRVSRALESGMVGVNEGLVSTAEAAFGGVKQSGLGREGSRHGVEEYTEIKYICIGDIYNNK